MALFSVSDFSSFFTTAFKMAVIPLSLVLRLQALKLLLSKLCSPLTLTDILTDTVRSQIQCGMGWDIV